MSGLPWDAVGTLAAADDAPLQHRLALDLPTVLHPGDLLVLNTCDTRLAALTGVTGDGESAVVHLSTPLPGTARACGARWPPLGLDGGVPHTARPASQQTDGRGTISGSSCAEAVTFAWSTPTPAPGTGPDSGSPRSLLTRCWAGRPSKGSRSATTTSPLTGPCPVAARPSPTLQAAWMPSAGRPRRRGRWRSPAAPRTRHRCPQRTVCPPDGTRWSDRAQFPGSALAPTLRSNQPCRSDSCRQASRTRLSARAVCNQSAGSQQWCATNERCRNNSIRGWSAG